MAYIGVQPADAYTSFAVQHFTTSATTSYTLDNPVANENEIALFINNVRQEPGSSYAYTASGTTLTLSAATSASDTMYCVFIGKAVQTVTPAVGSVTNDMLAGSIANSKLANSSITLNGSAVSLGGSASVANTPSFYAYLSSNISSFTANQYNTIVFGTEGHDSNSDYDTSTGIFTPSVAGKYFCFAAAKMGNFGDGAGSKYVTLAFFWNGTSTQAGHTNIEANGETTVTVANVIEFNGTTDNIRVRGYQNDGAGTRFVVGGSGNGTAGNYTWFGAYKLIGV